MEQETAEQLLSLHNVTLKPSTCVIHMCLGTFTAPKVHELVILRPRAIELQRIDNQSGVPTTVCTTEVFAHLRRAAAVRVPGKNVDVLFLSSDAGRITVLEWDDGRWARRCLETYGKTGLRRIVPGHYLAADPRGRCVMVAALEKEKFVYSISQDDDGGIKLESPLVAHKAGTVVYDLVAVDVGRGNPTFAALERSYSAANDVMELKTLAYYELDVGLNHLVRKWSAPVRQSASLLIPVPGGDDGPSGVLVCSENYVTWMHNDGTALQTLQTVLPRRGDLHHDLPAVLIAASTFRHKDRTFFLAQNESGDLFRLELTWAQNKGVTRIRTVYFDTVPPTSHMAISRRGFLLTAGDGCNDAVYRIVSLGADEEEYTAALQITSNDETVAMPIFKPTRLRNLKKCHERSNVSPLMCALPVNLGGDVGTSVVLLHGRNPYNATVSQLRQGSKGQLVLSAQLSEDVNRVFTLRQSADISVVLFSFAQSTGVYRTAGQDLVEVQETVLEVDRATMAAETMHDGSFLQVHPGGIRHATAAGGANAWRHQYDKPVEHATVNERQALLTFGGGEIAYFEINQSGRIQEVPGFSQMETSDITCVALAPVPAGRPGTEFVLLGIPRVDDDSEFVIFSIDVQGRKLKRVAGVKTPSVPCSAAIVTMADDVTYAFVGLQSGILVRVTVDDVSGKARDLQEYNCGTKPVRLTKSATECFALSSRMWHCCFVEGTTFIVRPLAAVDGVNIFSSVAGIRCKHCPSGMVGVRGPNCSVVELRNTHEKFHIEPHPVRYTPRRAVKHPHLPLVVVVEADQRVLSKEERDELRARVGWRAEETIPEREGGETPGFSGSWCSRVRLFNPLSNTDSDVLELGDEAAVSVATVVFAEHGQEVFVVVGTVKGLVQVPREHNGGHLHVFSLNHGADSSVELAHAHTTAIDGVPTALHSFQGMLAVGVGNSVRLYSCGKKRLLRKIDHAVFPSTVSALDSAGHRLFVGDATDSLFCCRYKRGAGKLDVGKLAIFADDVAPRWITAICAVDPNTVAAGDKFGNVFVLRLPRNTTEEMDESHVDFQATALNAAVQKLSLVAHYHVGEMITSISKATLKEGGTEAIVYASVLGTIGSLTPYEEKGDSLLMSCLQRILRQRVECPVGRVHAAFRSYYAPVKGVVDGDFVALFNGLSPAIRQEITQILRRPLPDGIHDSTLTDEDVAGTIAALSERIM